jgi:hypothetical protein
MPVTSVSSSFNVNFMNVFIPFAIFFFFFGFPPTYPNGKEGVALFSESLYTRAYMEVY